MGNAESLPGIPCGRVEDVDNVESKDSESNGLSKLIGKANEMCIQSPTSEAGPTTAIGGEYEEFPRDKGDGEGETVDSSEPPTTATSPSAANPSSTLFARALVNEVTDNPKTMTPSAMAEREFKLMKAQDKATKQGEKARPVGTPGGIGKPSVFGSIAHALTGTTDPLGKNQQSNQGAVEVTTKASVMPPNSMSENRAQVDSNSLTEISPGKYTVTIGLSLSRRSSKGHNDTVTRQSAFDFNEIQDREYKYVSSTDSSGWKAGGGESGGSLASSDVGEDGPGTPSDGQQSSKVAAPDTVHIPIIHIDAESEEAIEGIIAALARGEVFIPHMAISPDTLSTNGVSPPDLVLRFGTERNDDLPPDEWPNWCLEFMHNQLFEYFHSVGARWMKRPFSITLAKKVRWKTVKHMNRYFAHAERTVDAWREEGPKYLDPQLAYEGGATPEEVARPHGIYLFRNGVPTNYFAPNFDRPYTTKMTRSLLLNVLDKSWDKKRREWTSEPIPRLVTPSMLVSAMCGCSDNATGGFVATEATLASQIDSSTIPADTLIRSDTNSEVGTDIIMGEHAPALSPKYRPAPKPEIEGAAATVTTPEVEGAAATVTTPEVEGAAATITTSEVEGADDVQPFETNFSADGPVDEKKEEDVGQISSPTSTADEKKNEGEALSPQASTSTMDEIPSDEELFSVGWAKALDPNSGSYYYFTLDRKKTVWDNPLAGREKAGSVDTPSI